MVGCIAASRQVGPWRNSWDYIWFTSKRRGREEGRKKFGGRERRREEGIKGEERRGGENGNSFGFWNLKVNPQWHTSSSKAIPSNPSQTVPTAATSTCTYEPMMKSPHSSNYFLHWISWHVTEEAVTKHSAFWTSHTLSELERLRQQHSLGSLLANSPSNIFKFGSTDFSNILQL